MEERVGLRTRNLLVGMAAVVFTGMSGYELAETRADTEANRYQTLQIMALQKEVSDLRSAVAGELGPAKSKPAALPNAFEVFSKVCVCVSRNTKKQVLLCQAEGEICDSASQKACNEVHGRDFAC